MKRILILFSLLVSFNSFANWDTFVYKSVKSWFPDSSTISDYHAKCDQITKDYLSEYQLKYPDLKLIGRYDSCDNEIMGSVISTHFIEEWRGTCPDGSSIPEYPSTECVEPEKPFCDDGTKASDQAKQLAYVCYSNRLDGQVANFTWSCPMGTDDWQDSCTYKPYNCNSFIENCQEFENEQTPCNPATSDCPIPPEGGNDSGGNGGDNGGGDVNPPEPDYCELNPTMCTDNGDCQAPADAPWLCDSPDDQLTSKLEQLQKDTTGAVKDLNKTAHRSGQTLDDVKALIQDSSISERRQMEALEKIQKLNDESKKYMEGMVQTGKDGNALLTNINTGQGQLIAGTNQQNTTLKQIENELKKSLCDKNPELEDCNNVELGQLPTASKESPFKDILTNEDISGLQEEALSLQQDIKKLVEDYSSKLSFDINSLPTTGTLPTVSFTHSYGGTVTNSWWQDNTSYIRAAIIALATLVAFSVVMWRK